MNLHTDKLPQAETRPEGFGAAASTPCAVKSLSLAGSLAALVALSACSERGAETVPQAEDSAWVPLSASALYADDSGVLASHRDGLARANTSCEERLTVARELADVAASPGLRAMIQACAERGQSFSGELRCSDQGSVEAHCE
jgi:hypothetical protein